MDKFEKYREIGKRRILVVDDEEFSLSALKVILECAKIDILNRVDFIISPKEAI